MPGIRVSSLSLFRETSGGHSRSLASSVPGHFVAGPRFPPPILLVFATIVPPHPLPPSPLPFLFFFFFFLLLFVFYRSLIRTCLTLFLLLVHAFPLSSTRAPAPGTPISPERSTMWPFPCCVPLLGEVPMTIRGGISSAIRCRRSNDPSSLPVFNRTLTNSYHSFIILLYD